MLLFAVFLTFLGVVDSQYHHQICEHKQYTLKCEGTATLSITKAIYGRADKKTCLTGDKKLTSNTQCHLDVSSFAKNTCNGKANCNLLASNTIFNDPCHSTFKYLDVEYQCQDTAIACEGKAVVLKCSEGGKIKINYAMYGRTDKEQKCSGNTGKNDLCFIMDTSALVSSKCNGKNSCKIQVDNSTFNKKNVFTHVSKYMEVKYACHS